MRHSVGNGSVIWSAGLLYWYGAGGGIIRWSFLILVSIFAGWSTGRLMWMTVRDDHIADKDNGADHM
jgi:hypothetical protein